MAVAVAGAKALVFASCRQIVGIDDSQPGTSACGLPYGTTTCASCLSASCCDPSSACQASPTCNAYESCLGRCKGEEQFRSQCASDNPTGTDPSIAPLAACIAAKCETECGLSCGGGIRLIPAAAPACQDCVAANVRGHERACWTSVACQSYPASGGCARCRRDLRHALRGKVISRPLVASVRTRASRGRWPRDTERPRRGFAWRPPRRSVRVP